MGVVDSPKGTIIKLKLNIDNKPMNMRLKLLTEAKLVEHHVCDSENTEIYRDLYTYHGL